MKKELITSVAQALLMISCIMCQIGMIYTEPHSRAGSKNITIHKCHYGNTFKMRDAFCAIENQGKQQIQMLEQIMKQTLSAPTTKKETSELEHLRTEFRILENKFAMMQEELRSLRQQLTEQTNVGRDDDDNSITSSNITGHDCAAILRRHPSAKSYVYNITVNDNDSTMQVYCDMTTNGGGWTVFQRRIDGSELFYRPWTDYAKGFGNPRREFWLGNDRLAILTSSRQYRLRIDLGDWAGNYRYAEYSLFNVSDSSDKYRLTLGYYSGDAGDALGRQKGQQFSTYDQDNDVWSGRNCAEEWRGAWWFKDCHDSDLNGQYNNTQWAKGVNWRQWLGHNYSLRFSEMKIRPVTF